MSSNTNQVNTGQGILSSSQAPKCKPNTQGILDKLDAVLGNQDQTKATSSVAKKETTSDFYISSAERVKRRKRHSKDENIAAEALVKLSQSKLVEKKDGDDEDDIMKF